MDFCLIGANCKWVTVTNLFCDLQDPSVWIYRILTRIEGKECAKPDRLTQPFDPGPESALELLPRIDLSSAQVRFNPIDSGHSRNVLYCLSSPKPSSFPSRFELLISLGKEFLFLASKLRMRRHVSNRTVEPDRVVVMDVLCYCLTSND